MKKSPLLALISIASIGFALSACSTPDTPALTAAAVAPKDGGLAMPADYTRWPAFKLDVQKKEARQIRDIYVNAIGTQARAGGAFPDGTQFVMEIHSVKLNPDGTPLLDANGKMTKDKLSKVFLMAKGPGWGDSAPAALKNGDWIYTAFEGNGTRAGADQSSCRACHLPLADKDFVFHYDAYFKQRAGLETAPLTRLAHADALATAHRGY